MGNQSGAVPTTRRRLLAGGGAGILASAGAGCQTIGGVLDSAPRVTVPSRSVIGDPFPIRLTGFDAETPVEVDLRATDSRGAAFRRTGTISTDAAGAAEVGATLRLPDGSFAQRSARSSDQRVSAGVAGDGPLRMPLHHLEPVNDPSPATFIASDPLEGESPTDLEYDVTVEARVDDASVATTTGTRVYSAGRVTEQRLPVDGLVGWLYEPPGSEPKPGILCLHGSVANPQRRPALQLAAHGYVTVALQYFGPQDVLPGDGTSFRDMHEIPLEYFDRAVAWLTGRDGVLDDRIGVYGISRGGEPALLTGAAFDGPATVVSYVGSARVVSGARGLVSPWTRDGEPLYRSEQLARSIYHTTVAEVEGVCAGTGVVDCDIVAGIPVEAIDGPVLFLTGGDDELWPSPHYSEYGVWRLAQLDHPHPYAHITYAGAGHVFDDPYISYAGRVTEDAFGGSHAANSRAAADAWVRTLAYFDRGLTAPDDRE